MMLYPKSIKEAIKNNTRLPIYLQIKNHSIVIRDDLTNDWEDRERILKRIRIDNCSEIVIVNDIPILQVMGYISNKPLKNYRNTRILYSLDDRYKCEEYSVFTNRIEKHKLTLRDKEILRKILTDTLSQHI